MKFLQWGDGTLPKKITPIPLTWGIYETTNPIIIQLAKQTICPRPFEEKDPEYFEEAIPGYC
jgi:hypothetical protein